MIFQMCNMCSGSKKFNNIVLEDYVDDVGQYLQTGSRVGLGSGSRGFRRPDTTLQTAAATPDKSVTQPAATMQHNLVDCSVEN